MWSDVQVAGSLEQGVKTKTWRALHHWLADWLVVTVMAELDFSSEETYFHVRCRSMRPRQVVERDVWGRSSVPIKPLFAAAGQKRQFCFGSGRMTIRRFP